VISVESQRFHDILGARTSVWACQSSYQLLSNSKLRVKNTDLDNLVNNLRGEVGEIIYSWVLLRSVLAQGNALRTGDFDKDNENQQLTMFNLLADKLSDEIVARLSELAQPKVGRLTFHFAKVKLNAFNTEVARSVTQVVSRVLRDRVGSRPGVHRALRDIG